MMCYMVEKLEFRVGVRERMLVFLKLERRKLERKKNKYHSPTPTQNSNLILQLKTPTHDTTNA